MIAYISRGLTDSEKKLDVRELEISAVLFACEQLRPYLESNNRPFLIQTDHRNLTWLTNVKHDGKLARWALRLSSFPFHLEHLKGTDNAEADALSRNPISFTSQPALDRAPLWFEEGEQLPRAPAADMDLGTDASSTSRPAAVAVHAVGIHWETRTIDPQPSRSELIAEQNATHTADICAMIWYARKRAPIGITNRNNEIKARHQRPPRRLTLDTMANDSAWRMTYSCAFAARGTTPHGSW